MPKSAKKTLLKKATNAGVLLGAMGLWSASPVWAQDFLGKTPQSYPTLAQYNPNYNGYRNLNNNAYNNPNYNGYTQFGNVAPLNFQETPDVPPPPTMEGTVPPAAPIPGDAPNDMPLKLADETPAEPPPEGPLDNMWRIQNVLDPYLFGCDLASCNITYGAYTVVGGAWNPQHPDDRFNGPVTWIDRSNEVSLTNQWLWTEKATDTTKGCDWDWGYRMDFEFGTSSRLTTAAGWDDRWVRYNAFYGMAMPALYAQGAYKKWKLIAGHFISPVGYFTVNTALNFFSTLPYTYQYGEPFTHTGGLLTNQVTDNLILGGGIIRGWDNLGDQNHHLGYLGTYSYTFKDKSNIAMVQVMSQEPGSTNQNGSSFRYFQTLVYSKPLSERWNYVAQSDYGKQWATTTASGTAQWYGLNQYIYYMQSPCLSWGLNGEWFRDQDGFRVGGFLPTLTAGPYTAGSSLSRGLSTTRSGYQGNFFQATFGPKWTPNKNITVRPNFRYDIFDGKIRTDSFSTNGGGPGSPQFGTLKPYNNGKSDHQGLFLCDFIFTY